MNCPKTGKSIFEYDGEIEVEYEILDCYHVYEWNNVTLKIDKDDLEGSINNCIEDNHDETVFIGQIKITIESPFAPGEYIREVHGQVTTIRSAMPKIYKLNELLIKRANTESLTEQIANLAILQPGVFSPAITTINPKGLDDDAIYNACEEDVLHVNEGPANHYSWFELFTNDKGELYFYSV